MSQEAQNLHATIDGYMARGDHVLVLSMPRQTPAEDLIRVASLAKTVATETANGNHVLAVVVSPQIEPAIVATAIQAILPALVEGPHVIRVR